MQIVKSITQVREILGTWRSSGLRIAFVPTMGNLHAGHLKLVKTAKMIADKVVVSIFVNPTQFGLGEDFSAYPRTESEDCSNLIKMDSDLLFLPDVSEIYPKIAETVVSVKRLSVLHCGAFRAGHFDGVATVVCKLFNIVQPATALFGLKDYQQYLIIQTMVNDLNMPIELVGVDTVREVSGLAMSSRNGYLTEVESKIAPNLYKVLCNAREEVIQGNRAFNSIENEARQILIKSGFQPDYFTICNAENLLPAKQGDRNFVILSAAKLGRTRLIDNVLFNIKKQ